jgi:hypothetical protein
MDMTIDQPTMRISPARRKPKSGGLLRLNPQSMQSPGSQGPSRVGISRNLINFDPYSQASIQVGRGLGDSEQFAGTVFQFHVAVEIRRRDSIHQTSIDLRGNTDSLQDEFRELAARWKKATSFHSSLARKFMHEDYQSILAMGEPVIPPLLAELRASPDHWFWALKHIAREDPAKGAVSVRDAVAAWLAWGRAHHYIN